MKSKEQKRAEAIERARDRYATSPYPRMRYTEEEYLDLFRSRAQREEIEESRWASERRARLQEMGL